MDANDVPYPDLSKVREWRYGPTVTLGIGLGGLLISLVLGAMHPGPIVSKRVDLVGFQPVEIRVSVPVRQRIEIRLEVDRLKQGEDLSHMKRPEMDVSVEGATFRKFEFDRIERDFGDHVQFGYGSFPAEPRQEYRVKVTPKFGTMVTPQRRPRVVAAEYFYDFMSFLMIRMGAQLVAIVGVAVGVLWIVVRWFQNRRPAGM